MLLDLLLKELRRWCRCWRTILTSNNKVDVWREFVGLTKKKGKVYELGLHASTLRESSSGSQKSTDTSPQRSVPVVDTLEFKVAVAEVTSKLEVVQKASEDKGKELQ